VKSGPNPFRRPASFACSVSSLLRNWTTPPPRSPCVWAHLDFRGELGRLQHSAEPNRRFGSPARVSIVPIAVAELSRQSATGRAIRRPESLGGNFFLPQSDQRLTSSSRAAQFDKLTRRGKALDMLWIARDRVYSISETRGAVTQQIFRAGRAQIIVEATLGKPIGEAGSCAMPRREWADHDDTKPSSTLRLWRANLASSAVSRIRCRSHRARREVSGTFPKTAIYCHLLPFWSCKTATLV
jgi:hypothetical protein